jgi:hypothetical protein
MTRDCRRSRSMRLSPLNKVATLAVRRLQSKADQCLVRLAHMHRGKTRSVQA